MLISNKLHSFRNFEEQSYNIFAYAPVKPHRSMPI